jgi:hypothetical protein
MKHYKQRDIELLDESGGHYIRHLSAMTKENLHNKSDIAAELAYRDYVITEMKKVLEMWIDSSSYDEIINRFSVNAKYTDAILKEVDK